MSFVDHPNIAFTFLDRDHFESVERYRPGEEYARLLTGILAQDWVVRPRGYWTHCGAPSIPVLVHGWKIHVSSTLDNAAETLRTVAALCVAHQTAFKFCSDQRMLEMSFNKNASRSQVGKYITIFPATQVQFIALVQAIHEATGHLSGPYVFTDRRYRDSKVVYYRYGEHLGEFRLNRFGHRMSGFHLEDGTWYEDSREPRFRLPPGVEDPFVAGDAIAAPGADGVLLHGRYRLTGALKYSALGGVYRGVDESTGRNVVVREERSALGMYSGDRVPIDALGKEARILQRLAPTGCTPVFVDLFQEWEHTFLVQEQFEAQSLWSHAMGYYFATEGQTQNEAFDAIASIIRKIAAGLDRVHAHGVVLRDLTRTNVMVTPEGQIKFIDYEFAHELDDDGPWVHGWTPGYAGPEQLANAVPAPADDHYAFGVLILDIITFSASGIDLNRRGVFAKLEQNIQDLGLPMALYDIVVGLTHPDPRERWDLARTVAMLDAIVPSAEAVPLFEDVGIIDRLPDPSPQTRAGLEDLVGGIARHLDACADFARRDRLWPSSVDMYAANPIGMQYGACGPAWFLLRARGQVAPAILDWIDAAADPATCPPGLYSGLAGAALLFLHAGRVDRAEALMRDAYRPHLVFESHGLYFGASGWGLACLHFWRRTGHDHYLQRAAEVGQWLLRTGLVDARGLHWEVGGKTPLGLAEGQSGAALFLVYLSRTTGQPRYLEAAVAAMDFEASYGQDTAGNLLWQMGTDAKPGDPKSPHTWFGASGVGVAAIRCHAATGEPRFEALASRCAMNLLSRFTNKIWQFEGVSGFGELLLDMRDFYGDERYARLAYHQAEALLPHAIERGDGIAFAGQSHFRICTDFGEGSSGIGAFLDRLLTGKRRILLLDDLLLPARTPD